MMNSYRDLQVWQLGMEIVTAIYPLTDSFPKHEIYGLTSQIRRAAVSIPATIAEGHSRDSTKEFLHHLSYTRGSLAELETELILATRLGYGDRETIESLIRQLDTLSRKLRNLQKSLREK
jgi:four helix bundle protein